MMKFDFTSHFITVLCLMVILVSTLIIINSSVNSKWGMGPLRNFVQGPPVNVKPLSVRLQGSASCYLRPHLTSSRRPSLAADGRTYTVQALCTCIPLPTRISTMLPSTDSLSGGEHGITASSAASHIIRPDGACYTKVRDVTVPSL